MSEEEMQAALKKAWAEKLAALKERDAMAKELKSHKKLIDTLVNNGVEPQTINAWTKDSPSEPGWYWAKIYDGTIEAIELVTEDGMLLVHERSSVLPGGGAVRRRIDLWSGPITPPALPKDENQ